MDSFDKKSLTEADIRSKYVLKAITDAGWDLDAQVREELTVTNGRIMVHGQTAKRGPKRRADIVLYHKPNLPIAVVEVKDNKHSLGDGMQQGLWYAEALDVPFAYSTNGDAFLEHNRSATTGQIETEIPLDSFPKPDQLWNRYRSWRNLDDKAESVVTEDYHSDTSGKSPRYYQMAAINRTIEAIARGQSRILLVMATGTGKTYTAFQIIYRLWKSRTKKRILFLADRNILVDQTKVNDFSPFGDAMTKITHRKIDKSYEIYLALYQAVTGTEEERNIYKQFSRSFFDLIVVDECHRGSAAEDSAWREILEYFSEATQIGMTATPKETRYVSNIHYFGTPVYTYSLRQGIDDGFLAPYKVVRYDLDKDMLGWRPEIGKVDKHGNPIDDRIYNVKDMDRNLVLDHRTKLVATKITEFLKATDRFQKTIIFCEDIDHAERMRQALVNNNPDLAAEDHRYVMRITGDNLEGKQELDNFIDPESRYPVLVTTSKLLTTGVDAQTCSLIVLDQSIQSLSQFKQIIGRGTRVNEDYGKLYFTIIDFRRATELFADPDWDGEPVDIYEGPPPPQKPEPGDGPPQTGKIKYYVDDVSVEVLRERVQYLDPDGKLITESLTDYTRKNVRKEYTSLDSFLQKWTASDRKNAVIEELNEQGVLLEALAEEVGREYDPFDLVCHVAFGQPPLTRQERARNVRKRNYFTKYGDKARLVLEALLDKYAESGVAQLETMEILQVQPISEYGTPVEIVSLFGGKDQYLTAIRELETQIYSAA